MKSPVCSNSIAMAAEERGDGESARSDRRDIRCMRGALSFSFIFSIVRLFFAICFHFLPLLFPPDASDDASEDDYYF